MREATFSELGFGETAASEAKMMLEEHATGWGLKRDIDDDDVESLVLTWKGHSVVFCIVLVTVQYSSYVCVCSSGISSDELEKVTYFHNSQSGFRNSDLNFGLSQQRVDLLTWTQMPTGQHHVVRTDTSELKSQLEKKIGRAKTESYLNLLSKFLSLKISKPDFDKLVVATVKKENIVLHNALLRGIIKNVCLSKTSNGVEGVEKKQLNGVKSLCNDLPKSPRKGRTQRRVNKDCNGSKGKSQVTEVVSSSFKQQWSMEDGEEVDQLTRCWRSQPIEAPFGVNLRDVIKRRPHVGTCYSSGELPDSISLKKKVEEGMEGEGLEVSAGFANSLNAGLNVFLKRLIKPCLELAASRSSSRGEVSSSSSSISMVDFQVAMELNPSILGEDWSTKLEKIRLSTPDFQTS
ncbi:hypothetical protein F2Q70_00000685 [Brassica cretica]|uniref:Transcriptional coactivator Hfi1/Transcriptional adapter 1 n=1 Tax=Brassica cretica TaxID=69181 RepID=A0A8S9IN02_BRACR|nr:hypothetical protein F2Q70_00000685 [Brassica cretica]